MVGLTFKGISVASFPLSVNTQDEEVDELKSALHKASALFELPRDSDGVFKVPPTISDSFTSDNIISTQYGPDMDLCASRGTDGCTQFEQDTTEYFQQSLSTPFVCLDSLIFHQFARKCLCLFCETSRMEEELWYQWTQSYESQECEMSNHVAPFKFGDDLCEWLDTVKSNVSPKNDHKKQDEDSDTTASQNVNFGHRHQDMRSTDSQELGLHDDLNVNSMLIPLVSVFAMLVSAVFFIATI